MFAAALSVSTEAFVDSSGLGWVHHLKVGDFRGKHSYGNVGSDTVTSTRAMQTVIEAWFVQRDCESIETMYFRAGSDREEMKMIKGMASLVLNALIPADPAIRTFERREDVSWRENKLHSCSVSHTRGRSEIVHVLDDTAKVRYVFFLFDACGSSHEILPKRIISHEYFVVRTTSEQGPPGWPRQSAVYQESVLHSHARVITGAHHGGRVGPLSDVANHV
jgi:hypothetical protein